MRDRLATLYREQSAWPKLARARRRRGRPRARQGDEDGAPARGGAPPRRPLRRARGGHSAARAGQRPRARRSERCGSASPTRSRSARRFDEASAILQAMIDAFGGRRPKERAPVHYQIARLQLSMGNRARALVELDTATRVDPQNPEILRALAELARDDGQLDRAEKSYRALLVVLRRREPAAGEAGEPPAIARSEVLLELSAIADAARRERPRQGDPRERDRGGRAQRLRAGAARGCAPRARGRRHAGARARVQAGPPRGLGGGRAAP